MKELRTVIIEPVGLHARPATIAVNAASKFKCDISLTYMDKTVNMKSIMGVMSLSAPTQAEVIITCEGEDEDVAIQTIEEILVAQKVIGK